MIDDIVSFPVSARPARSISVTAYQAKAALADFGFYDQIVAAINDPLTPVRIRLAWESNLDYSRENEMVLFFAESFEWSDDQLDQLFLHASTIVPGSL